MKSLTKYLISLLAMMLILTTSTTGLGAVNAQEQPKVNNTEDPLEYFEEVTLNTEEASFPVSDEQKESLLYKALDLIENEEVTFLSENNLIFDQPEVRGIEYDNGLKTYSVSFNYIEETEGSRITNLNIVFDENEELKNTFEIDVQVLNSKDVRVDYWQDGEGIVNQVINVTEFYPEGQISPMGWMDCMQSCLAGKGLTMMAITALFFACGFACTAGVPATAGTACYACVNTAGIIGVNSFIDCMDKC